MRSPRNFGMILLGIWLVVINLVQIVSISVPYLGIVMAILGLAAGVLILIER